MRIEKINVNGEAHTIGNYYIVTNQSGTVGSSTNASVWTGTVDGITELYTGLTVVYKIPIAGSSKGVVLNINNLGGHPVCLNAGSLMTTYYPVESILILVYDAEDSVGITINGTTTTINGVWKISNYDSNSVTTQSVLSTDNTYPMLLGYTANATANIGARGTYFSTKIKANPSTGIITASGFVGATATDTVDGLMASEDKAKLDVISASVSNGTLKIVTSV